MRPAWVGRRRLARLPDLWHDARDRHHQHAFSGAVHPLPYQLAGDRAAQWIRWIHEGGELGPVWRTVVLLTGIFPTIFAMTGLLMWLRGRRQRRAMARLGGQASVQATLQAAE